MVWKVEFTKSAKKELDKLDKPVIIRILEFLNHRLSKISNPRSIGESLKGAKLSEFWKYRIGDYRLICDIKDNVLTIAVIKV